MTVFITHCLRSARLDLFRLLVVVALTWASVGVAQAESLAAEISQVKFDRAGEAVLLSAAVKFELSTAVEDALLKGVAMIFVAEADVFRERWYWTNKRVASAQRHMRLAYQPLTRRWRLNVSSGVITNAALGVALNQNFDALLDALAAMQRLSHWKIADISDLDIEQRHIVEFRFRLDVSQLPRPLQIGTLGQSDWDIAGAVRLPLTLESTR